MEKRPKIMRSLVVGLGVQGYKRRRFAGSDYVGCVDPNNLDAQFKDLLDVPLSDYDAVLLCVPDQSKLELIRYLLTNKKNVLVEKPLWTPRVSDILELEKLAIKNGAVLYTAYNHRFEPHFVRMRELIASGQLGKIYSCRMFYGNGTARLVAESAWRDRGAGVLPDLGSHLLDTYRFWFGNIEPEFSIVAANRFENRAPDHVVLESSTGGQRIALEMTLLMWRNHFTCDILAENGSAHIEGLCKWGPASFTHRKRIFPSGRPPEESVTLVNEDPTWALEYEYFKDLCLIGKPTDLSVDYWVQSTIDNLATGMKL